MTVSKFFATLFGIGYIPQAPGTWASLFTIIAGGCILWFTPPIVFFSIMGFSLVIGYLSIKGVRNTLQEIDASEIVIDEWIGQWVALWPLAIASATSSSFLMGSINSFWPFLCSLIFLFVSFRFFDILKLGPIGLADQLKTPIGVILDDLLAGIISGFIFFLVLLIYKV